MGGVHVPGAGAEIARGSWRRGTWAGSTSGRQRVSTSKEWVGPATEAKERDFAGLMTMHLNICRAILGRQKRPAPYLFIDLHGGPGMLEYPDGHRGPGSPLIAVRALEESGMPYQTVHFERDPQTAGRLRETLAPHIRRGRSSVITGPFETGMSAWLAANGREEYRHGLIYSDPISDPIPVATLNECARYLPRVDLLAYVIANDQYKRANGGGASRGRIADDIKAVRKEHVLIRRESTAHQFTFIIWSRWDGFPDWKAREFHRLASPTGQLILDRINYTKTELRARFNTPLPLFEEGDDALPATSAGG